MKRLTIFVACLALLSLACLQTVESDQLAAAHDQPVMSTTLIAAEADLQEPAAQPGTAAPVAPGCAVVIAEVALHVRQQASENALVLDWLQSGELVRVLDRSESAWWYIQHAGGSGYARARFLRAQECD